MWEVTGGVIKPIKHPYTCHVHVITVQDELLSSKVIYKINIKSKISPNLFQLR